MTHRGNDSAGYIGDILRELVKLACADRNDTLAYLLEIAALEAMSDARSDASGPSDKEQNEFERMRRRRIS